MNEPLNPRVELREPHRGHLVVDCPRGFNGTCRWSIWTNPQGANIWHWDGNIEHPTVTPSVACDAPGCSRHFTVVKGVPT